MPSVAPRNSFDAVSWLSRTSEISIWNWPGSSLAPRGSLVIQMQEVTCADLPGEPESVSVARRWRGLADRFAPVGERARRRSGGWRRSGRPSPGRGCGSSIVFAGAGAAGVDVEPDAGLAVFAAKVSVS